MIPKLHLAHTPTPLWHHPELDDAMGCEVWVKRDDMTAGAEAGNKIRKLEYLLAEAQRRAANVIITCGGAQSNHARATALLARQLGMRCELVLRREANMTAEPSGNLLLDRLAGARVTFVSEQEYGERSEFMEQLRSELAESGQRPFVIPEGGSNGLGALGYVDAMTEIRRQAELSLAPARYDLVVVPCGSGGTAAGVALGARLSELADEVLAVAVCGDAPSFTAEIGRIVEEARVLRPELPEAATVRVSDDFKGPAYGVMSEEQSLFLANICARTGLVLDPTYSGKAFFGLSQVEPKPERVLLIHTGGLPGLLASNSGIAQSLAAESQAPSRNE